MPALNSDLLRALMAGYQEGSAESFDELYALLAPVLRRMLTAEARDATRAEDLLQETFLQIHRARRSYDPSLPVEPWARAIARHVYLMHCRKTGRRQEVPLEEPVDFPSGAASPEAAGVARDELARALARLTPARRKAVLLHHHEGLGFDEVGERLGIAPGAARLQASRGVRKLREILRGRK